MQPGDVKETFADISAIERDHGFKPTTTIDEGVPRFVSGIGTIIGYSRGHEPAADPSAPPHSGDRRPLFIVSNPEAGDRAVHAGIVGSFPALNAARRAARRMAARDHRGARRLGPRPSRPPAAPFAVNQIVHRSNDRFEHDMEVCAKWKVPIVITSLGARVELNERFTAGAGSRCTTSSTTASPARRSRKAPTGSSRSRRRRRPCRALVAVRADPGNPLWFDGPLILSGAIANGGRCLPLRPRAPTSPMSARRSSRLGGQCAGRYKQAIVESGRPTSSTPTSSPAFTAII
jgi:nitronate monooxygenase